MPLLEVENLTIVFGARTVVDGISFSIAQGQTLGLVGESGSGKSATSLALLRLLPANASVSGRIVLDGQPILQLSEPAMRRLRGRAIGMIFQEPMTALNPVMRVGNQVAESLLAHHPATAKAEVHRRVVAAMHEVGLPAPETRLRDYPHQFSGGQRQRILIAMALINRPRLPHRRRTHDGARRDGAGSDSGAAGRFAPHALAGDAVYLARSGRGGSGGKPPRRPRSQASPQTRLR